MAASLDRAEIGYLTYPSLSSHGILQMLTSAIYRVRTLLRFAYAHVQMMLYRPFLHYVSPRLSAGKTVDDRYYACAAAAISVSRNIVHIGMETRKQTTLIGPYWFILYTEYFAILALVFYALENPEKQGSAEILADATAGKEVIASLAQRSMAADRVTGALSVSGVNCSTSSGTDIYDNYRFCLISFQTKRRKAKVVLFRRRKDLRQDRRLVRCRPRVGHQACQQVYRNAVLTSSIDRNLDTREQTTSDTLLIECRLTMSPRTRHEPANKTLCLISLTFYHWICHPPEQAPSPVARLPRATGQSHS